jgi:hypothetical protein
MCLGPLDDYVVVVGLETDVPTPFPDTLLDSLRLPRREHERNEDWLSSRPQDQQAIARTVLRKQNSDPDNC